MELQRLRPSGHLIRLALSAALVLNCFQAPAAPESRVALSSRTITVEEAFKEIERQTGMIVVINHTAFDTGRKVALARTEGSVGEVVKNLLAGTDHTYELSGNYIILRSAPRQRQSAPAPAANPVVAAPEKVQGVAIPAVVHREVLTPAPVPEPAPRGGYPVASRLRETPHWAVKTNLLGDATASIALGTEIRLAPRWTLDVPVSYNGWDFSDNRKWKHLLVQPGARFWLCESFNGHFFGLHAHWAWYNVGNLPHPPFSQAMRDYRYYGYLAGGGVSYGYQWILGKRWALEGEIGAGYAYLWYDKYKCQECGRPQGSETRNYFGPTKASLSLIFMIK